jgi:hypothetical protein
LTETVEARRQAKGSFLPSSWIQRTVALSYTDCRGEGVETHGRLRDGGGVGYRQRPQGYLARHAPPLPKGTMIRRA